MKMAVNVQQYVPKLEKLLEKFSQPNFEIENDVYLNTLLSNLAGKENNELGKSLRNIPLLTKWICDVISYWESNSLHPSQSVGVFILNLLSLLSKDDNKFMIFETNNIYKRIIDMLKIKSDDCNPSLKLGYIKLLSSLIDHVNGLQYVVTTDYWNDALKYCLSNQTVYIIKEGREFIYDLLEKTKDNSLFGNMLVRQIVSVLSTDHFQNGTTFPEIREENLKKSITPTLELISYILEEHFKSSNYVNKNHQIPILFIKNCDLEQIIWRMILMVQNPDLLIELEKIIIMIYFLEMHIKCNEDFYSKEQICESASSTFQLIKTHIAKREVDCILKLCYWIQYLWQYVMQFCPDVSNEKQPLLFENQILALQMMPIFGVGASLLQGYYETLNDDLRDNYVSKLFKIMCECTIRTCYSWRSVLIDQELDDILKHAQLALHYLTKSGGFFKRDTALIYFEAILYGLKDMALISKTFKSSAEFNKYNLYVTNLTDVVISCIEKYDFTWRDSIETICIMSFCIDTLNYSEWPPKAVIRTLKLLNMCIGRFMAPNLALLVDQTSNTPMENLGTILLTKLQDFHWEIRDSALEVLDTIAEYSEKKFPSFQKIILLSNFPCLIVTMSISDRENYVRASAIKCLQKMIQVSAFWYSHLEQAQIPEKMIQILLNEAEGIVRCEAATLICNIYFYQSFQEELMPEICKIMSHAATSDLHWEVKLNALMFWEHLINNQLQNQGMIDGSFPTVTFSKEHKKIVTLTNNEITTRLNKALIELSKCGCLGVLTSAVMDDCDLQVAKKAVEVVRILSELLKKYNVKFASNVSSTSSSPSSPTIQSNIPHLNFTPEKTVFDNDILEEILDAKDINLLSNMFTSNSTPVNSTDIKEVQIITPDEFLNFIQKDLDSLIVQRQNWLNEIDGLNSLLDDMLKTYHEDDNDDVNRMDCY